MKSKSIRPSQHQAMSFEELLPVIHNGPKGATLPSSLTDGWLFAAVNDLHQYFFRLRDFDSEGNFYLTGPMCLLRKLLKDKGLHVPGEVALKFLSQYMVELEFEKIMRNDPSLRIEPATLDNIFEPERESVIGGPSDLEVAVDRKLAPGSKDENFERLIDHMR